MRRIWICVALLCGAMGAARSQNLRLNLYGNYVFDDHVESYYSSTNYFQGKIHGGFLWGAGLEYRVHDAYGAELVYFRQDTKASVSYAYNSNLANSSDWNLGLNYIMLGGTRSLKANEKVEPYGGLMLGVAIIDANNDEIHEQSNATKFAWGLRLGTNIWATDAVGIKLQAMLLSAVQAAGGSV